MFIEGSALLIGATSGDDGILQLGGGQTGSPFSPGHGGDVFFHQGSAQIITAPFQSGGGSRQPQFDPAWLVIDNPFS